MFLYSFCLHYCYLLKIRWKKLAIFGNSDISFHVLKHNCLLWLSCNLDLLRKHVKFYRNEMLTRWQQTYTNIQLQKNCCIKWKLWNPNLNHGTKRNIQCTICQRQWSMPQISILQLIPFSASQVIEQKQYCGQADQ